LSYEETLRLIRIAADLGVTKIRITGGEPLTRREIVDFIRQVPGFRDSRCGSFDKGTLLAREIAPNLTTAAAVRAAGVRRSTFHSILWIETFMPKSPGAIFFRSISGN
jgi:cyclic pyranopterin phosphate synthase